MSQWILILVFAAACAVGYLIIRQVPTLLHTPLMSGMNALSGITVLGALTVTAVALGQENRTLSIIIGLLAIALAMVNVAGGFGITARMLRMFKSNKSDQKGE